MKVVPFQAIDREQWQATCTRSSQAWFFHRPEWIDLEERYFVRRNYSFGLLEGEELIGIMPLYLSDIETGAANEKLLHCGVHRHTGLALREALPASIAKAARSEAMREVLARARALDADRVQLNSHNLCPENLSSQRQDIPFWVYDYGFYQGVSFGPGGMLPAPGISTCNADQIVSLADPTDALFAALDESCRRAVRKATSHGLQFVLADDENEISDYCHLAELAAQRTREQLRPEAFYRSLWETVPRENCVMAFVRREGRPIAGLILLMDKQAASFFAAVSHPDTLSLRVNDFLHWSAIVWAKMKGFAHYRFGPWFPEVPPDWPIARVSYFKTKFGGRRVPVIQGSLFLHPAKYEQNAQTLLSAFCSVSARQ